MAEDIVLDEPVADAHKTCPFHKDIIALKPTTEGRNVNADKAPGVMERFLGQDASEQAAIVAVAGNKNGLNISKNCKCDSGGESARRASL